MKTGRLSLIVLGLYCAFATALAVARDAGASAWLPSLVMIAIVVTAFGRTSTGVRRDGDRVSRRHIAWSLIPLIVLPVLYAQVAPLVAGTAMHDAAVLSFEHRWFGDPSRDWAQRWPAPMLGALLHAGYLSYYALIYLPPLRLVWLERRLALEQTILALTLTFVTSYLCFVLWPVEGPRYRWMNPGTIPDEPVRRVVTAILERFSSRGAAFPSSHVSVAVTQTLLAWRWQPRIAPVLAVATVGLALGAVYGGFHYLTDVLAGVLLGTIVAGGILWGGRRSAKA